MGMKYVPSTAITSCLAQEYKDDWSISKRMKTYRAQLNLKKWTLI